MNPEADYVLKKGDTVRCRNSENDLVGTVLTVSENGKSVAVVLEEIHGIRMNGALAVTNMLPLTIDYEAETVTDLFGNPWEVEYAEGGRPS